MAAIKSWWTAPKLRNSGPWHAGWCILALHRVATQLNSSIELPVRANMAQTDPSQKLDAPLRWHLHLVSSYRCENKGDVFSFSHEQIKDLLLDAAAEKNTTERPSAWSWQKLDLPRDRTSLIVWQSDKLPQDNVPPDGFPTDGYAWGDPPETSKEQVGDFVSRNTLRLYGLL